MKVFFSIILIYFLLINNLSAYADPGSGSFIIQAIIAFFGALIIFLKNPIFFIKSFFNNLKAKTSKDIKKKDKIDEKSKD